MRRRSPPRVSHAFHPRLAAHTALFDRAQLVQNLLNVVCARCRINPEDRYHPEDRYPYHYSIISLTTASISLRAIEILLGSFGNCNTSNQLAASISSSCVLISPLAHSQTNAIISECGNGQGWLAK